MGAALGAAGDLGIEGEFKQRVQDLAQPGTSAIFVVLRKATPDKFLEALQPYGGTVLRTSLTHDAEQQLMKTLHGDDRPRQPGHTHSLHRHRIEAGGAAARSAASGGGKLAAGVLDADQRAITGHCQRTAPRPIRVSSSLEMHVRSGKRCTRVLEISVSQDGGG
jgi:hypothetical protein